MTHPRSGAASELDPAQYLGDLDTDHVYFCPNPGNAGDSAIAVGAYRVFRSLGLTWTTVEWNEEFDSTGTTVLYGGGGNLAAAYPQARSFLERHHRRAGRLILLPHTIQGNSDLLSALESNVVVFCREMTSFEHVKSIATGARVHLADDFALKIDIDSLLERRPSNSQVVRKLAGRSLGTLAGRMLSSGSGETGDSIRSSIVEGARALRRISRPSIRHLYALRRDREAVGGPPPRRNVDVSAVFSFGVSPESTARESTVHLLSYLDRFDRITTNRLHVCILGAMLGKDVRFHANSYFKNEAVFRYSLENRFPDVNWCGEWTS